MKYKCSDPKQKKQEVSFGLFKQEGEKQRTILMPQALEAFNKHY